MNPETGEFHKDDGNLFARAVKIEPPEGGRARGEDE